MHIFAHWTIIGKLFQNVVFMIIKMTHLRNYIDINSWVVCVCVCVCVCVWGGGGGNLMNLTITKSGIVIILYFYYVDELHYNTHGVLSFYLTNFPPKYLGPTRPKWSPYWPHEFCYLGCAVSAFTSVIFLGLFSNLAKIFIALRSRTSSIVFHCWASASLNLCIMDHHMSWSISGFQGYFFLIKSSYLVQMLGFTCW